MSKKPVVYSSPTELDGRLPMRLAFPFGLQHVLAMFVGNLSPLLIIMSICGITADAGLGVLRVSLLQNAMLVAGINTMIQVRKLGPIGSGLPIVMGTSSGFIGVNKAIAASMMAGVAAGTITTSTLTLDNVQVDLKATLSDNICRIELSNNSHTSAVLGDKKNLSVLLLGNDTVFSAYKTVSATNSATSEHESELTIDTLEVGSGATLNANLVFTEGSVLIMEDCLAMGSDVALTSGMSLTLSDSMLQELYGANGATLFTGVDTLTLDGEEIADGSKISADGVFSNLDTSYNYSLSYANETVRLQAIPEPATATLSLAALALLAMRRRRA